MITENLSTLKIHKLTQTQYDRELAAGNIDSNALYLTPDEVDTSTLVDLTSDQTIVGNKTFEGAIGIGGVSLQKNPYTSEDNGLVISYNKDGIDGFHKIMVGSHGISFSVGDESGFFNYGYTDAEGAKVDFEANNIGFIGDSTFNGNVDFSNATVTGIDIPEYITTGAKSGTTIGISATAEGNQTTASSNFAHAEGNQTTASGTAAHAEGFKATASGSNSHAEGNQTTASGSNSHTEGASTTASGFASHAEGYGTTASGDYSHAGGYHTTSLAYQFAVGKYNNADSTSIAGVDGVSSPDSQSADETLFVVGYGTSATNGNAFRISANGKCRGVSTFTASGADFAELFEWEDGNPNNEDRRGLFVVLEGEKIKLANDGDDFIGVISGAEAFLGNAASEEWQGKYLTDVFGTRLTQTIEIPEEIDEETGKVITPAHTVTQYILNPDYNPNEQYIMREKRKEWGMVGLLGQVVIIDDGTCVVGGYVKPSLNGVGTASDSGYRVMKRIDETHIKVLVK